MSKIYKALGTNVFVQEVEREMKVGELYIPDSMSNDFTYGEVISCSDVYVENGNFIGNPVKPGDVVVFPKVSGTKVTIGNNTFIRVRVNDIVAVEVDGEILN